MNPQFETIQKAGKANVDAALKSLEAVSKGVQALAVEAADYAKKSFEQGTVTLEKIVGAKSLDKAVEIQSDYAKTAYEGLVAQVSKVGELVTNTAKEAFKPYEGLLAQAK